MGYDDTRVGTIYRNRQGYAWLVNLKQLLHNFLSEVVAYRFCIELLWYGYCMRYLLTTVSS